MSRRLAAEFIGTMLLLTAIVGSGIMGESLSDNLGVTLLINVVGTIAALGVLIWTLGSISGGHFNPAVTMVASVRREMPALEGVGYVVAQIAGAIVGVGLANLMFGLSAFTASTNDRSAPGLWLGEVIATGGLLWVIGALTRTGSARLGPALVPLWIGAAFVFTSSTSFANPAVTIARSLTDTFSGIALASVGAFILFQLIGAGVGAGLTELFHPRQGIPEPLDLPGAVHDQTKADSVAGLGATLDVASSRGATSDAASRQDAKSHLAPAEET